MPCVKVFFMFHVFQATRVGVDTRLLGKPGNFSGAQDAWRDWSTVFKGYAGEVRRRPESPKKPTDFFEDDESLT